MNNAPHVDPVRAFRRVVLRHLLREVSPVDFQHFRVLALDRSRWVDASLWAESAVAGRVVLVSRAVARSTMPLRVLLESLGPGDVIGSVVNADVYYWPHAGIYACADQHDYSIDLWLTAPAYPPGW